MLALSLYFVGDVVVIVGLSSQATSQQCEGLPEGAKYLQSAVIRVGCRCFGVALGRIALKGRGVGGVS